MSPGVEGRPGPTGRVIVVGDIVTDILAVQSGPIVSGSDTDALIRLTGGGSAANTAAWLAYSGVRVELVGVVGTDPGGADRLAELARHGVGCAHVRRQSGARTGCVVVLTHEHERSMLCDRGANLLLSESDVECAITTLDDATHLHLSGYTMFDAATRYAAVRALKLATERGMTTSVDAGSAAPLRQLGATTFLELISGTNLLFANLDEARTLLPDSDTPGTGTADDLARHLTRWARNALVKRGAAGAVWAGPRTSAEPIPIVGSPALPVTATDPTGAGDAFAAGVLSAWLLGVEPKKALHAGIHLGAEAVSTVGARPPVPANA